MGTRSQTPSAFSAGTNVHFSFGIPRGGDGPQGQRVTNGADGQPGPHGPPFPNFNVDSTNTLQPWKNAHVQTSYDGAFVRFDFGIPRVQDGKHGPEGPQDLPDTVVNPNILNLAYRQRTSDASELQQVIDKLNELMNALRRPVP